MPRISRPLFFRAVNWRKLKNSPIYEVLWIDLEAQISEDRKSQSSLWRNWRKLKYSPIKKVLWIDLEAQISEDRKSQSSL